MLNAIIGEVPVVVLPGEGLPYVLLGLETLHELDHLQVRHIDLRVLRQVVVLLGIQHTLCNRTCNSAIDLMELKLATVHNDQICERYFNRQIRYRLIGTLGGTILHQARTWIHLYSFVKEIE
jgi:hypothetical protein